MFAIYAALAARDVMLGDALELVAVAIRNGPAHPPGYPLWIVLTHAASLVPIGSLAYRANLTACLYHALTVSLVYVSGYVLVRRHGPALFAALFLAIASPLFVTWSLQAEVFSLNDLFASAIVLLCLLWLDDPSRWRLVVPIAALFGLGLSNHQTLVLLAPLPLWTAWCGRAALMSAKKLPQTLGFAAALLVLAFCLPYLHTILASRQLEHWEIGQARSFSELVGVIDRSAFGSFNLVPNPTLQGGSPLGRAALLVSLGGWPYAAVLVGVIGLALRRRYPEIVFAALIVAGPLLAFCLLANLNLSLEISRGVFSRFGLLPLVALAPFSACAAYVLESVAPERSLRTIVAAAVACGAFLPAALRLPALSLAGVHDARAMTRDIFAALPPHAILLAASDPVELAPAYFQTIEGLRPDVTLLKYGFLVLPDYLNDLRRTINVPQEVAGLVLPADRRDLLAHANPTRPFYVVGDRPIHAAGQLYKPLVEGVVSQMTPLRAGMDVPAHYAREKSLESRHGYGDVNAGFWKSNGFGVQIREFYAAGFFSTGLDAKYLGDFFAARYWFERASEYASDPLIGQELQNL